ncbi:response regulator [Rhizobium sp. BK538]|uniref:response regulator n=1 Tax=Rhizobium sp. BK538 TaxID=2586984 RepID=UPI001615D92B|nr:response regulator [Rhizobium sp. BK538]MBB4170604.1 two-component system response regulator RegA [Rhizobium sp. BK538]
MTSADLIHSSQYPATIAGPEVSPASPLVERLIENGLDVCLADNADAARRRLRERTTSFAVVELVFYDGDGIDLVQDIANSSPRCRTLVHSRFGNLANAVQAIKSGAGDVLPKPTEVDFVIGVLVNKDLRQPTFLSSFPAPDQGASADSSHTGNLWTTPWQTRPRSGPFAHVRPKSSSTIQSRLARKVQVVCRCHRIVGWAGAH